MLLTGTLRIPIPNLNSLEATGQDYRAELGSCAVWVNDASRPAIQRNFAWMEARGLVHEVTGQGRYRMWRIVETRAVESRSILGRHDGVLPDDLFWML